MYNKNNARIKTTSCGAVVWRVNPDNVIELLLIKQFEHKDSWGIPKGHIKQGESLEDCAMREVKEETGVSVSLGQRLQDIVSQFRNEDKTVVSYLATPTGSHEPTHDDPDNEVADAKWHSAIDLPVIHAYQRQLIQDAISIIKSYDDTTIG